MYATPELTPAEAMVLMDTGVRPAQLFKVTVMALMLQGLTRAVTDERRGWLRTRRVTRLYAGLVPGQPDHVQSALAVIRRVDGGTVADVVAAARTAYGSDLGRFKQDHVIPALSRRHLVQHSSSRVLWVFSLRRLTLTPGGTAALERLRAALDRGRTVPAFLDSDPRQAAMIAASLGTLILLVEELRPHLKRLAQALVERDDGGAGDGGGSDPGTPEHHDLNLGWDAGAFDALDGDMDGFDAGFDAGFDSALDGSGSDGGGDSGGGDGGGGGGGE